MKTTSAPIKQSNLQTYLRSAFMFTVFGIGCFGFSHAVQAVSPPPDGGYPNGNTAEGNSALAGLTTGFYNSAVGFLSLLSNGSASFNTGVGAGTLLLNTANENTATGAGALLSTTSGVANTANGAFALFSNTLGEHNTAIGDSALFSNTEGDDNTAIGDSALFSNTEGTGNTAVGTSALGATSTGGSNTAVGVAALGSNSIGSGNTAIGAGALDLNTADGNTATGFDALANNTTGVNNAANGAFALVGNTTGDSNTADGYQALQSNTTSSDNTAVGGGALASTISGSSNTAIGKDALFVNITGFSNTALGGGALFNNTTGSGNIAVGIDAGVGVSTASGVICIGATGQNTDFSCYIGNISGADATGGDPVFVTSDGKLGTVNPPSSARFKEQIIPMDNASEAILALKPVTFRYKKEFDPKGNLQFGLIAEEVEKVNPNLVKRDRDGKLQTVRYDAVNAMLLNEFLKEHKKVEEQQVTIAELRLAVARQRNDFEAIAAKQQQQIQALVADIQKVSAQLTVATMSRGTETGFEVRKSVKEQIRYGGRAPRVVVNNP